MMCAVSDIHGCYDQYQKLLDKLRLKENDTLYVLGDVIDRGPDGFRILCDMASRPNVVNLMGNHEAMALDAIAQLVRCAQGSRGPSLSEDAVELWFSNGGEVSLRSFLSLEEKERQTVWNYIKSLPLYQEVTAGDSSFLLVHGGLGNFSPTRPLEDYQPEELLWCRPEPNTTYFPDRQVILGHTPTQILYKSTGKPASVGKIFRTDSFIDIDCGCVCPGGRLGCLCLDTMEEFYI